MLTPPLPSDWPHRVQTGRQCSEIDLRTSTDLVRRLSSILGLPDSSPPSPPHTHRLGVVFCPLLPVIGLIKYIFIFYCRAWVVYFCNQPPHTVFRVSSTLNFYLGILFATMLLCFLPVGYALLQMVPSDSCGPFRWLSLSLSLFPPSPLFFSFLFQPPLPFHSPTIYLSVSTGV